MAATATATAIAATATATAKTVVRKKRTIEEPQLSQSQSSKKLKVSVATDATPASMIKSTWTLKITDKKLYVIAGHCFPYKQACLAILNDVAVDAPIGSPSRIAALARVGTELGEQKQEFARKTLAIVLERVQVSDFSKVIEAIRTHTLAQDSKQLSSSTSTLPANTKSASNDDSKATKLITTFKEDLQYAAGSERIERVKACVALFKRKSKFKGIIDPDAVVNKVVDELVDFYEGDNRPSDVSSYYTLLCGSGRTTKEKLDLIQQHNREDRLSGLIARIAALNAFDVEGKLNRKNKPTYSDHKGPNAVFKRYAKQALAMLTLENRSEYLFL